MTDSEDGLENKNVVDQCYSDSLTPVRFVRNISKRQIVSNIVYNTGLFITCNKISENAAVLKR